MSLNNVNLPAGSGIAAVGTQLAVSDGMSPATYKTLGNQAKIATNTKVDSADTTNQGVDWDQSIPTLHVGGEVSVEIFYIPDSDDAGDLMGHSATDSGALVDKFLNNSVDGWRLTYPDGSGFYFDAFVMEIPVTSDPTGKALTMACKLKSTGPWVAF